MKLWLKISLITAVTVSLLMGICSGVFVYRTVQAEVQMAIDNYYIRFKNSLAFLEQGIRNEPLVKQMEHVTFESLLAESARSYLGQYYAIVDIKEQDRELYNRTGYIFTSNEDWLRWSGEGDTRINYMIQTIDDESTLVLGSYIDTSFHSGDAENGNSGDYYLFAAFDLTDIYARGEQSSWSFAMITLVFTLAITLVVSLLIKAVLMPLKRLEKAAVSISRGDYEGRIEIKEEDEVGRVGIAFNEMADKVQEHVTELQEANERQRILLGSLTHEMKTPMTSIIGYADTLMNVRLNEEQQKKALTHIHQEGKRMERLSAKLMGLIGLYDNDAIQKREGSAEAVIHRAGKSLTYRLQEKDISLSYDCHDFQMAMDEDLMEELLINLIDNSIRASKPGAQIQVSCGRAWVSVSDSGMGIPAEDMKRITEPFYMVDKSRSKKEGGIGLGLSIVKLITELHAGRLYIESVPGEGTTVKVVFDEEN